MRTMWGIKSNCALHNCCHKTQDWVSSIIAAIFPAPLNLGRKLISICVFLVVAFLCNMWSEPQYTHSHAGTQGTQAESGTHAHRLSQYIYWLFLFPPTLSILSYVSCRLSFNQLFPGWSILCRRLQRCKFFFSDFYVIPDYFLPIFVGWTDIGLTLKLNRIDIGLT